VMVGAAVATEPDEAARVGVDAVLGLRPVVALARAAPGLDEVARLVEFEHRRRGHAFVALVFAHAGRALQDPGMALRVDRYARDLAPDPLARQLWPRGIRSEERRVGKEWRHRWRAA